MLMHGFLDRESRMWLSGSDVIVSLATSYRRPVQ